MNAVLKELDWIEEESFIAEHWDDMVIDNPSVPVGGIWKDGLYICLYNDNFRSLPNNS